MPPLDPRPLFLIGFMATGKTTVGRLVAARLGRRFLDLDEEIARATGRTVPELFEAEGEQGFRRAEAAALAAAATLDDVVVACGGGTPCFGDNLARMRGAGIVVALAASIDEVTRRGGANLGARPLLAAALAGAGDGPEARRAAIVRLAAGRAWAYQGAQLVVPTDGRDPEDIADEVAWRARLHLGDVGVRLGARSYPVHLAPLAQAGPLARDLLGGGQVALVTDENVARAGHATAVAAALGAAGVEVAVRVVLPPGEDHKRLAQVEQAADVCAAAGLDRGSAIVGVGGGVVTDVAGLLAALLFRGVAWAAVPTTLLGMVDAAIGGKTGVDLEAGKNLVGAFWQPRFVLADRATLASLPERELGAGFGEVLKAALAGDPALFAELEREGRNVDLGEVVRRGARYKAGIVAGDEREADLSGGRERGAGASAMATGSAGADYLLGRTVLNLGHTIGHAIETASTLEPGGGLRHGEAVALGLIAAARVSCRLGLCGPELEPRVTAAVRALGLPADPEPWLRAEVLGRVAVDKKRTGGRVRFVALQGVGRPVLVELTPAELAGLLLPPTG